MNHLFDRFSGPYCINHTSLPGNLDETMQIYIFPEKCLSPYKNGSDCAQLQIREPYTFEFLGLKPQDVVTESDLEDALINHLQEFLLEFGKGMCFEARQQRIIIDDEYYYPDLIFYNRIGHFSLIVERFC